MEQFIILIFNLVMAISFVHCCRTVFHESIGDDREEKRKEKKYRREEKRNRKEGIVIFKERR